MIIKHKTRSPNLRTPHMGGLRFIDKLEKRTCGVIFLLFGVGSENRTAAEAVQDQWVEPGQSLAALLN